MEILLSPDISSFDEKIQPLLKLISREIGKQKKRLGGDFAVAHAVVSRKSRDMCRELIGPDVTFIVMNLTKSCQKKRLEQRHGSGMGDDFPETLNKMFDAFEPAGDDEEGALNVMVDEDMSP